MSVLLHYQCLQIADNFANSDYKQGQICKKTDFFQISKYYGNEEFITLHSIS